MKLIKTNKRVSKQRNYSGMVSTILVLILLGVVALGALSMDLAHGSMVKDQLQTATDAGALAGAQELTRATLYSSDISRAEAYAYNITASNNADNIAVSNKSPQTQVSVTMATAWSPRTVTVTATRQVDCLFAKLIGWGSYPVRASSTAGAYKMLTLVRPNQIASLAVSLDNVPSNGPMKGESINSIVGPGAQNQIVTLILAPTKSENSAWIKDWSDLNPDSVEVGIDSMSLVNGVKAGQLKELQPGQTLVLPLFKGKPPYNYNTKILGLAGFTVTSVGSQEIEGHFEENILLSGVHGEPAKGQLTGQDKIFNDQWAPWQVVLID